jgi:aromatic ring-opening dioxygenase catalytic subunit (LigB family)
VGFVDAFYLLCYSGQSKFEHGIVVYSSYSFPDRLQACAWADQGHEEDDDAIRSTLQKAKVTAEEIELRVVNKERVEREVDPGSFWPCLRLVD